MDAGIIKNFKVHYRRLLIKGTIHVGNENASMICKSVNVVLLAIRWIKPVLEDVSVTSIKNSFQHCGMDANRKRSIAHRSFRHP